MSDARSFCRFKDLPTEIRLLIWAYHFDLYFESPHMRTLNGGFLSWETGQLGPLFSLRSIISRGRLLKSLADRYDWHVRDVPILQWKTVIHDFSPVTGKIYSAHRSVMVAWPRMQPLINHEAFSVARTHAMRHEIVDLWLDGSTLNISQPCLVDVTSDVFRIDLGIAKMMGLSETCWVARIRRLAIGPFETRRPFDASSIWRILERTRDVEEIYVLLSPDFIGPQTRHHNMHVFRRRIGPSMVEARAEEHSGNKTKEYDSPPRDSAYVAGDSDCAVALRGLVDELRQRCRNAKITYGCLDV
ncbi:hypothetical protein F4802DRAFT_597912 [Xylaria palmicola]|nr:hypothetical protein F4802DRAFT_597912 [Xylaria palmicola]